VNPKIEIRSGKFYLTEEYKYIFDDGKYVVVPEGYETNFASIPWYFRWLINPIDPEIVVAALVHDWLVQEWGDTDKNIPSSIFTDNEYGGVYDIVDWNQAAAVLREIMSECSAPLWKRQCVYLAVRIHGILKGKK
jgi:hypothetical protein